MEEKLDLENLYRDLSARIYKYSYFHINNKEDAEDITMEVFTRILEKGNIGEIENIKNYSIGIARNIIFDKYKVKKIETNLDETSFEVPDLDEKSHEEILITEEQAEIIKGSLEKLDDQTREVIVLKIWEGMKFAEIAELTGEKVTTVKLRYYRGLEKIKLKILKREKIMMALPALILGVGQIALQPEFKVSASLLGKLSKVVSSALNLNINLVTMDTIATTGVAAKSGLLASLGSSAAVKITAGVVAVTTVTGIGAGSYYITQKDEDKRGNTTIEATPTPTVTSKPADQLKEGWVYANIEKCGIQIPQPPKSGEYYVKSGSTESYWGFRQTSDPVYYDFDFDHQGSMDFLTYSGGEILGSGQVIGDVSVYCSDNGLNYTTSTFADYIKSKVQGITMYMGDEISCKPEMQDVQMWGMGVKIIKQNCKYKGNSAELSTNDLYVLVREGKLYMITSESDGTYKQDTVTKEIFEKLKFETAVSESVEKKFTMTMEDPVNQEIEVSFKLPVNFTTETVSKNKINIKGNGVNIQLFYIYEAEPAEITVIRELSKVSPVGQISVLNNRNETGSEYYVLKPTSTTCPPDIMEEPCSILALAKSGENGFILFIESSSSNKEAVDKIMETLNVVRKK